MIDQAIDWAEKYGMYVYIDYHSIGWTITKQHNSEWIKTSKKEIIDFWDIISKRYANNNVVAFYEIFNELTAEKPMQSTIDDWLLWKEFADEHPFERFLKVLLSIIF